MWVDMARIVQRRNRRVACVAPMRAEGPRGPLRGVCRSLSLGGLYFTGPLLPVGSQVEWVMELPGNFGRVRAVGEVRYHHTSAEGPGMGVRILRLLREDLQRLARFIDAASAAP